ncbi:hypothetical protein [Prosthecobacter sp.]|uniref:hypothetical protein n=1 Tax=Prosthecobacter sp. TaxID=1965333 RepID=UPI003782FE1D
MHTASIYDPSPADFELSLQARLWRWLEQRLLEKPGFVEGRHQGPRQKLQGWQIIVGLTAQCLHCRSILQHFFLRG